MGPCPKLSAAETGKVLNLLKKGNNPKFCKICETEESCLKCPMYSKTVQEVLIESYVPTVYMAVKRICFGVSYKEDFISAGIMGVVKAVNKVNETIEDPHAYIYTAIVQAIKREMVHNTLIPIPHSAYKKGITQRVMLCSSLEVPSCGEQTSVDLDEIINSIPCNKTEKCVLKHVLMQGFTGKEIADEVSVSMGRVSQIKHSLLEKLYAELVK